MLFGGENASDQQISPSVGTGKTFYPIEQASLAMVITWA